MKSNPLRTWISKATRDELARMSKLSKISLGVLRQIAGGYRTEGAARTTPDIAREIHNATNKLTREGLPAVTRDKLCPACAKCEYLKEATCNGK